MSVFPDFAKLKRQLEESRRPDSPCRVRLENIPASQAPANTVVQKFDTDTIQIRFERFHYGHPEVYEALVRTARALRLGGIQKIGIAEMWEGMRNSKLLNWSDEEYKLCNDYRSRYARLIHEQEDDLRGFFRTRQLTSK
jgi:hypothetical protein